MELSDHVTVLRGGRSIATVSAAEATPRSLAALMVGRELGGGGVARARAPGEPVLEVKGVWTQGDRGEAVVKGASLVVRAGEIVAVAGVAGKMLYKGTFNALCLCELEEENSLHFHPQRIQRLLWRESELLPETVRRLLQLQVEVHLRRVDLDVELADLQVGSPRRPLAHVAELKGRVRELALPAEVKLMITGVVLFLAVTLDALARRQPQPRRR